MGIAITAGILLVNENNEVLIAHPTNHDPNFWSIPKGKIEEGESLWECALRETYEEVNVKLSKDTRYSTCKRVTYRHKKKAITTFIVREDENTLDFNTFEFRCNSNVEEEKGGFPEMDDFKWVSLEEAKKLIHYAQLPAIEKVERLINEESIFNEHINLLITNFDIKVKIKGKKLLSEGFDKTFKGEDIKDNYNYVMIVHQDNKRTIVKSEYIELLDYHLMGTLIIKEGLDVFEEVFNNCNDILEEEVINLLKVLSDNNLFEMSHRVKMIWESYKNK